MPLFNLYNIPFFVLAYLICRKNKERDAFFEKNNKNKRKSLRCIIEILLFVIFFAFSFFCFFFSFFIRKSIIDNMTNLKNFCRFYDIFQKCFCIKKQPPVSLMAVLHLLYFSVFPNTVSYKLGSTTNMIIIAANAGIFIC